MVDDSELDYLRTFMMEAHAAATAKSFSEVKNISLINDDDRVLVYPGGLISSQFNHFIKRYRVKLSQTSEITLTTILNDIVDGIEKLNKRIAVGSFTKPNTMCNMKLAYGNKPFENPQTKRWDQDIFIDVEWSSS